MPSTFVFDPAYGWRNQIEIPDMSYGKIRGIRDRWYTALDCSLKKTRLF